MISRISGTVLSKSSGSALLDVHGIGFRIFTTPLNLAGLAPGDGCSFSTHLAVKQDALDLYGFRDEIELAFFTKLLTLPGIGPKSALAILASASVETLIKAVAEQDPHYLTKMSGMGKKSAEKVVAGLKDKLDGFALPQRTERLRDESDIIEAIVALGYSHSDARNAAQQIPEGLAGIGDRVKAALKLLGTK